MHQILIYSDSLSWGIIPDTRKRLPFDKRWAGVFESTLKAAGKDVRVIENCLNGRRTCWPDPYKDGRDGSHGLAQVIEMHSPLTLVILMLGTNDFQSMHNNDAWVSAQGMAKLVEIVRKSPVEPGMPVPDVMVVCPPLITEPKGDMAGKFQGAEKKCAALTVELARVTKELSTLYFDSNTVTTVSQVDGVHLDANQHELLGRAVAGSVIEANLLP
jgi:lysophospholipase L1-like esterase